MANTNLENIADAVAETYTEADLLREDSGAIGGEATVAQTKYDLDSVASLGTSAAVMGKGMLGIFVVIAVLIGCVYALNAAGSKKKKEKKED